MDGPFERPLEELCQQRRAVVNNIYRETVEVFFGGLEGLTDDDLCSVRNHQQVHTVKLFGPK